MEKLVEQTMQNFAIDVWCQYSLPNVGKVVPLFDILNIYFIRSLAQGKWVTWCRGLVRHPKSKSSVLLISPEILCFTIPTLSLLFSDEVTTQRHG